MTCVFLSYDDLSGIATVPEHIEAVRSAYRQRGNGSPTAPRTSIKNISPPGLLNSYIAILPKTGVMGGYVYSAGFDDEDAWLMTPIFDSQTGRPLALLDGSVINTYKTGAVGAVGIDALAREESAVLSVFGSGAQAYGQVLAAVEVRDFEELLVYSPTADHRKSFASEINERLDVNTNAVSSPSEAVKTADVIITATTASEPVFDSADLQSGTHINAIGQYDPEKREIAGDVLQHATYVPDLRERVFQDAGLFLLAREEGLIDRSWIHGELGEVLTGDVPGRKSDEEITIFDSGGTAIETLASAELVYRKAVKKGLGMELSFTPASEAYEGKKGNTSDEL